MRLLLDTNQILFATQDPGRLTEKARDLLWARSAEVYVSAASWWEIVLKARSVRADGQPKLVLKASPGSMLGYLNRKGVRALDIEARHTFVPLTVEPPHHDPFDRLLLQPQAEDMRLLTSDRKLKKHPLVIHDAAGHDPVEVTP